MAVSLSPRGEHMHELTVGDDGTDHVFVARHNDDVHVHLDGETWGSTAAQPGDAVRRGGAGRRCW